MRTRYDWENIRMEYEAGMTQTGLSRKHGVSRAAISRRAKREGWKRNAFGSDSREDDRVGRQTSDPAGEYSARLPAKNRNESEGKSAIIRRHREEWNKIRILIEDAVTEQDADAVKLAKITAETLKIRQEGERKAWGIQDKNETEISGGVVLTWQK